MTKEKENKPDNIAEQPKTAEEKKEEFKQKVDEIKAEQRAKETGDGDRLLDDG